MRGVRVGTVALAVAAATLYPAASPAQQETSPGIARVCQSCEGEPAYTHFITCAPQARATRDHRLVHWDGSGEEVGTQTEEVPAGGCSFYAPDVPDGHDGTAVFPGDPQLHTMVVTSVNPDGTGPSSATPVAMPPDGQPTYTPMAPILRLSNGTRLPSLEVCNAGLRTAQFDTFFFDEDGDRTRDFLGRGLAPSLCLELPPEAVTEIFPGFGSEPGSAQTFTTGNQPASTYELLPGGPDDVPARVPGAGTASSGPMACAPVGPLGIPYTLTSQNLGSNPADVDFTTFAEDGEVTFQRSFRLGPKVNLELDVPAGESACVESTSPDDDGIIAAAITLVRDLVDGAPTSVTSSGSIVTKQEDGIYFDASRLPSDPVTKRAIAFGAVRRERRTTVNVVMQNITDRRTKARVIVRDGDGDRVFARTMRAPGHGTARRKYLPRARGDDLWADVRVRGGGKRVFVWLERIDPSGDVTLYPAFKLR